MAYYDNSNQWFDNSNQGWSQFNYNEQNEQSSSYGAQQGYNYNQYGGQMFIPSEQQPASKGGGYEEDFENEPPLLEELGIDFDHIRQKTLAVLNPLKMTSAEVIADQDLAGPLAFCLLFGFSLLLSGKVQFGYIYGIGLVGCVGMFALLNLMAADHSISFTCTASVLGYCLLPMAILSLIAAVLSLQGLVGYAIATAAVLWCGQSSSKLFTITLAMEGQRLLVAYPCTLLYGVFALLAIF